MDIEKYDHLSVEGKWQKIWDDLSAFNVDNKPTDKKTKYILDMFPYPSGSGLHVGHPEGYTATDILARFYRMKGEKVLHTMGWDAFGLPAENYAIKTKIHPATSTADNIINFTQQIKSLGFSYDWNREIATCLPNYYKWTQWFFLFLYKRGLAYKRKAPVNWCESCKTVLANEQVIDNKCDRCKSEIVQKNLNQWFFKITDFIEDRFNPDTKRTTAGLISGLDKIDWPESTKISQRNWIGKKEGVNIAHKVVDTDIVLESFSAFPAWLFADTYIVIAPEHSVVEKLVEGTEYEAPVKQFIEESRLITAEERNADKFEKKGIFTGRYAINPFFPEEKMPIWLANFALLNFGTGIIRCSSHDKRDLEFARKYKLDLKEVVERTNPDEPEDAHPNVGILKNSGPFSDRKIDEKLIQEIVEWTIEKGFGKRATTYKLRDWLVSRQRYWGSPIPIIHCAECGEVPVPENELPVELPTDVDFMPTGESPLTNSKSFNDVKCPKCSDKTEGVKREYDTMDTFVCSSWYFWRFLDAKNEREFASKNAIAAWGPVDIYVGGAEHTVLHLLYSRFFTKALHYYGEIDYDEPFLMLRHQGMILGEDGEKMSKSKGNVINPNEIVEKFGADTLRIYEMFMGPFKDMKPWSTNGVVGVYRFIQKIWRLGCKSKESGFEVEANLTNSRKILLNQTIKKVTEDTVDFKFNTAVSQLMIFVNSFSSALPTEDEMKNLLLIVNIYAPHIASELWEELGFMKRFGQLHEQKWPEFDPLFCEESEVEFAVQINGKLKGTFKGEKNLSKENAIEKAKECAAKFIGNSEIVKEIFVPGKLVNLVIKQ